MIADGLPALRTLPMFRGALRLTCSERACKKMLQKASVPSGPVPLFQKQANMSNSAQTGAINFKRISSGRCEKVSLIRQFLLDASCATLTGRAHSAVRWND